jgi:hypothetical protein
MDAASIAAISSGMVGLAAIIAGELRHRRSLRHAQRLADVENARALLDDAATALHEVEYALDDARSNFVQHGQAMFEDEVLSKPYRALRRAGKNFDRLLERLKVRLGPGHDAVAAFEAANAAVLEIYRVLGLVRVEPKAIPGDELSQQAVSAFMNRQRARMAAERETFDAKRVEFIMAAYSAAGTNNLD